MRDLPMVVVLLLTMTLPQLAWADNPMAARSFSPPQPPPAIPGPGSPGSSPGLGSGRGEGGGGGVTASDQLRALFKNLDIGMIAKAHAAECEEEGEICKTNADCCSGLECTGDPQPTCQPEE
jgi:hypothetical protein